MRKILLSMILLLASTFVSAQTEYTITAASQGKNGSYMVNVVVSTKKNPAKEANDLVLRYAVEGIMFRGAMAESGYNEIHALVTDGSVRETKADYFKAFNDEGKYKNYASLVASSLSVVKNKQTKRFEASAKVLIDKESLMRALETDGIIKGFTNLW